MNSAHAPPVCWTISYAIETVLSQHHDATCANATCVSSPLAHNNVSEAAKGLKDSQPNQNKTVVNKKPTKKKVHGGMFVRRTTPDFSPSITFP